MTAARKLAAVRRHRERVADGRAILRIEINLLDHTDLLVSAGVLGQWDADDRAAIERATERLLRALASESEFQ